MVKKIATTLPLYIRVSNETLSGTLYYNIFLKSKSMYRADLAFVDHRMQKGLEMDICIWILPS